MLPSRGTAVATACTRRSSGRRVSIATRTSAASNWPAAGLALLLAGLCIPGLAKFHGNGSSEDWRAATRSVHSRMHPGDSVRFFPEYARQPFEYYEGRAALNRPEAGGGRVWLVIRESDAKWLSEDFAGVRTSLGERYRLADRHSFPGVGVELYVR